MATRSTIWLKESEDKFIGIYYHFDGYLDGNGKILFKHYKELDKVKELIALGAISSLGKEVKTKSEHSFENPEKDITVAYCRDRGEKFHQFSTFCIAGMIKDFEEYNYLYQDGKWFLIRRDLEELETIFDG